ncbi:hypothetical protein GGI04_001191 [Coemansia thaxteri]|uniref:Uncharacterized protein n=1 Tax=Coemansia thaxteri TaxID=2663907 RepID=A0A9W8EEU8_9FUNG|nr:hypothetical protein H4R26_003236 [Coemansia thaxteri]KAJ2008298.1 hypothetical protein GGI04_001191 [Coemansia thaxteri]KAJ2471856.1 hypothetical protein GGI02_001988 [Coemansia sp. RSA 2322]KAJ2482851.1 hypothetical protein EV174_003103 [Coemansia sp. RSA 2320]
MEAQLAAAAVAAAAVMRRITPSGSAVFGPGQQEWKWALAPTMAVAKAGDRSVRTQRWCATKATLLHFTAPVRAAARMLPASAAQAVAGAGDGMANLCRGCFVVDVSAAGSFSGKRLVLDAAPVPDRTKASLDAQPPPRMGLESQDIFERPPRVPHVRL